MFILQICRNSKRGPVKYGSYCSVRGLSYGLDCGGVYTID
jgi:hypothetical protein